MCSNKGGGAVVFGGGVRVGDPEELVLAGDSGQKTHQSPPGSDLGGGWNLN